MANKNWIADRGKAIMQEEVTLSAKGLKDRLQREYNMKLEYSNVWKGRDRALAALNGTYQENFQLLWNFKVELLAANPGSVCEIDIKRVRKKGGIVHYFNLSYREVHDATFLTNRLDIYFTYTSWVGCQ